MFAIVEIVMSLILRIYRFIPMNKTTQGITLFVLTIYIRKEYTKII